MRNISLNNESIRLKSNKKYIVIDALYIDNIRQIPFICDIDNNSLEILRTEVFPYTDTPFAEFNSCSEIFKIEQIKKINYHNINVKDNSIFSTDTGLIIFINKEIFSSFIKNFSYEDLVNSDLEIIDINYWDLITNDLDLDDVGLILSSGLNYGVDFSGSGTYKVTQIGTQS